jgi:hypothetical protein
MLGMATSHDKQSAQRDPELFTGAIFWSHQAERDYPVDTTFYTSGSIG